MVGFFIVIGSVGLLVTAVWTVGQVSFYEDPLFFLRKKQFKNKLVKSGYQSTWDLVDSLMQTKEHDWGGSESRLVYQPYPNTQMIFRNHSGLSLEIYEGSGVKSVFKLCYFEDEDTMKQGEDLMTGKVLQPADQFRMKHVLLHLNKLLATLTSHDYQLKLKARLQDDAMFSEMKQEVKEQLLFLMNQELPLEDGYRRYGFTLSFKREKNYQSLLISFDDVLYFQALQMEYLGEITTTIHHTENQHAQIFTELEREIILFSNKLFADHPLGEKTRHERYLKTFEEHYDHLLFSIQQLTLRLESEQEWLSVESLHYLNETFPNDVKALSEVYRTVENKEEVRNDVEDSLHTIRQKLESFANEVERNKRLQIKKTKLVIEKR